MRFPNSQFSVIAANSDSRIKEILNTAKNLLTDIQKSPYRDRILAVVDSVHGGGLRQSLVEMGMLNENVIAWTKNGIEYLYPPSILDQIFNAGGQLEIINDQVSRNGITYSKNELSTKVVSAVNANTEMSDEFEKLFLGLVKAKI